MVLPQGAAIPGQPTATNQPTPFPTPAVAPAQTSPNPLNNMFGTPPPNAVDQDNFEYDFTGVEAGGFIQPGVYPAKSFDIEKGTSQKGDPMTIYTFEITGPNSPGRKIKMWCSHSPTAMWKNLQTLEALGLAQGGQPTKFTKAQYKGRDCQLDIGEDEYNGRKTNRLNQVMPPVVAPAS